MSATRPALDGEEAARLRALPGAGLFESADPRIDAYMKRQLAEGAPQFREFGTGPLSFFDAPARDDLAAIDIACVGVPMEAGIPIRPGPMFGPRKLREWTRAVGPIHDVWRTIPMEICSVADIGDVEFSRPANVEQTVQDIFERYVALSDAGVTPLSVGGVHTITHPIVEALGRDEPLGLIHLDCHCDTLAAYQGQEVSDGSLFRNAVLSGAVDPQRTIQIGVRGRYALMWDFSHASGMRVVSADELERVGVDAVVAQARAIVGGRPCYLSVDLDAFDSSVAPGTEMPEPFGLTSRQGLNLLRGLRGLDLVGADLVEMVPDYDQGNMTALLGAGLLFEMLCLVAEAHVRRTGAERKTHWKPTAA
ncbi:MAG: guanidinopropionase [bacterium]